MEPKRPSETVPYPSDRDNIAAIFAQELRGDCQFDPLSRYLYSTDASSYQVEPLGVVFPRDIADLAKIVQIAAEKNVPVIPRGGGSSLSGQGIGPGIIVDTSRYFTRIREINPAEKWAWVESGVVLETLNTAAAPFGLMVGPDPSSAPMATLGGMTANNSTGAHSIRYGMMVDHVREVKVVLSDGQMAHFRPVTDAERAELSRRDTLEGQLYREIPVLVEKLGPEIRRRYPKTWRNVAGYNLNRLLADQKAGRPLNLASLIVGSEGTLAAIAEIKVHLVARPEFTHLTLLHYKSLHQALSDVPGILQHRPEAVELLDKFFLDLTRQNPEYRNRLNFIHGDPGGVLVVEFGGDNPETLQAKSDTLIQAMRGAGFTGEVVVQTRAEEINNVWQVRKDGLGLLLSKRGDAKPLAFIDDAAVPVEHLAAYVQEVQQICREAGTEAGFYAHASAGCLHINPTINLKTAEGIAQFREISQKVIHAAIAHGGTSTGEHGEGLARSYYNKLVYGDTLHQAFCQLKGLFDPQNIFNPGKIVDEPAPWDPAILRFNPAYRAPHAFTDTYLDFSSDQGFAGLVEMCNGQGFCRKTGGGVMCPSYRVTRDETHSTRGRANALRAAMTGKLGPDGMYSRELYDALDLCLECKACKSECPSLVDMARLKYEFLAHYQQKNGVPLSAKLFGNIAALSRMGSITPGLANFALANPLVKRLLERVAGIDRRRSLPHFAKTPFRKWFRKRQRPANATRGTVVLWDDTFLSYSEPEIGMAAVKVLQAAGFAVLLPERRRCCGRPMISKGLLAAAQRNAAHNVQLLYPFAEKGIPIIGLEPSCIATFRDEYPDLLRTAAAKRVAEQSFFMEEFLTALAREDGLSLPWKADLPVQKIWVHGHCYQKALIGTTAQLEMLRLIPGAVVEEIPAGCCGMAGSFGYEKKHYELSLKCGEERLFPAVREAGSHAVIAAAGTSCRHQILDGTGIRARHPVTILGDALAEG